MDEGEIERIAVQRRKRIAFLVEGNDPEDLADQLLDLLSAKEIAEIDRAIEEYDS